MPLHTLPDRFDAATHHELDRAVDKAVEDDLRDVSDLGSGRTLHYRTLLHGILENSNGDLDTKYTSLQHSKHVINTHGELRGMLDSAWKDKSYRRIRNLAILKAPAAVPVQPARDHTLRDTDLAKALSESFKARYHGAVIDGFYEYLTHNENVFKKHGGARERYYAKFCSIVQSSGTGKSRLLTELRKKGVIIIYMNLREEGDGDGFPARDQIPSSILTNFPSTAEEYQTICYAFLIALFETLDDSLSLDDTTLSAADVMGWVDKMCDMSFSPRSNARKDFFEKLAGIYKKTHADLVQPPPQQPSAPTGGSSKGSSMPDVHSMATETEVDLSEQKVDPLGPSRPSIVLSTAYKKVGGHLAKIFPDASNEPKLVIAIDEAHPLSPNRDGYRPASIFCRAVNDYTYAENHAVWVVFASTTSKVADFSPPSHRYDSARVAMGGEQLFPPYTQLGWDQSASGLAKIGVEDVARLDHILGYGRPLWMSLKTAHGLTHKVLRTASWKLYGADYFNPRNTNHVLAIFGQRFGLNITLGHPDSVEYLERGVASHLLICLATTLDRNWRFTSYPSEPLLSCVAASDLHANPAMIADALGTLMNTINSGMIDTGQRGELASRLLWLLAKDIFIRERAGGMGIPMPKTWDEHLADCEMIPVVDWLEFVFGPQVWDMDGTEATEEVKVRKTKKQKMALPAREAFEDAYLNFSHWVGMEANIAGPKEENKLSLGEFTLRHWQRTSAVQCCHQQPLIDKMIPIYFKGGPENAPAESRMSQILVSDKARKSSSQPDLHSITRTSQHLSKQDGEEKSSLPYIAILADLGRPSSLLATFPERDVDDRCLRIYAAGVDITYPFLTNYPVLKEALRNLVHLQQIPETERPYTEYLNAQVKFGSTATPEHMVWERGRDVPNVKGKSAAGA